MKLHNGSLYWPKTVDTIQAYPELQDTMECDVLIVGGGMSGALCANTLSKYDLNTIVVEKTERWQRQFLCKYRIAAVFQ